jgi:hypothetical protein
MLNACETASRSVDRICNRQFGQLDTPQARTYTAQWHRDLCRWVIDIDDLMTVTGLLVDVDSDGNGTYDQSITTGYELTPINAAADGRPWTRIEVRPDSAVKPNGRRHGVRVTAKFGWMAVPQPVKQASLIQAARLFARRHAPFGVVGNPEVSEMRLLEKLDVDLVTSVKPYIRVWGCA